jgi:hypothetical protein
MTDAPLATPAAPPALPPTPDQAEAKLTELRGNKEWVTKFLAGNGPEVAEYGKLSEIALGKGDEAKVALAMAGQYLPVNDSEHITRMGTASMLREAGIADDVIRQALSGSPVTQQERDAAEKLKAKLMRNADFSKKYLAGDAEAKEQMTLLQIITSSDVKQEQQA